MSLSRSNGVKKDNNAGKTKVGRLLIPLEYERDINIHSGFLTSDSTYSKKTVKGLFKAEPNVKYLCRQLFKLLTSSKYIDDVLGSHMEKLDYYNSSARSASNRYGNIGAPHKNQIKPAAGLASMFQSHKNVIIDVCEELVLEYKLPYDNELSVRNPVVELAIINKKFLIDHADGFIKSPDSIISNYFEINPDTNQDESKVHANFSASSYSSGVWKPEDLFLNVNLNKEDGVKKPSWTPVSVEFDTDPNPEIRGPGHKWRYRNISVADGNGNVDPFNATVHRRNYDYDNSESLPDAGTSDRRTQRPSGYDMSTLTNRSSIW